MKLSLSERIAETAAKDRLKIEFDGLKGFGYSGYVTVHQAYAEIMGPAEAMEKSAQFLRGVGKFEPTKAEK